MRTPLLVLTALSLAACVQPLPDDAGFDDAGLDDAGLDDAGVDDAGLDDHDDGDLDDPEDPTDEALDHAWAMPPDPLGLGSTLQGTMICGLFVAPAERQFTFDGEFWAETTPLENVAGVELHDGLEACLVSSDEKHLEWSLDEDGAPFMYLSGSLHHDLLPSETEDLWLGAVYPVDEPTDDCLDALVQHGLTLPVALTFAVHDLALAF